MFIEQKISAQNCTIEMPKGHEVGQLQNITINANYNLQPFKNLYEHTIQYYAQGISTYNITAQRAFIDLVSMFGEENSLLNTLKEFEDAKNILKESTSASDQLASLAAGIGLAVKYAGNIIDGISKDGLNYIIDKVKKIIDGQADSSDLFTQMLEFDVIVKNPLIKLPDFVPDGLNNVVDKLIGSSNTLFTLSGCKIMSRNITITPSNIIIMENVNIVAKKMTDSLFSNQKLQNLF